MPDNWKESLSPALAAVTGAPVMDHAFREFGREHVDDCISTIVSSPRTLAGMVGKLFDLVNRHGSAEKKAYQCLIKLRESLPAGYVAYIGTTRWLGKEVFDGVELAVGPGKTQFDILRHAQSDAGNFDLDTEDLIKRLQAYDQLAGIDIFHAETDTVEFNLRRLPDDVEAFAGDLYDFCPDLVDQGFGEVSRLADDIRANKRISLWWD